MSEKKPVVLTPDQYKVATHIDGPLIVLAGAGSGKTATMVERTDHLIQQNIPPTTILLVTFSRKAATELGNRISARSGWEGEGVVVDTFHSFGYRFLRNNKELFGLSEDQHWAILGENDQRRMLNELAKPLLDEQNIDARKFRKYLLQKFSDWSLLKQDGKRPGNRHDTMKALAEVHQKKTGDHQIKLQPWDHIVAEVLQAYEQEKHKGAYLDYDDLLLHTLQALVKYPAVAESLAQQFRYIMVDESQDTNLVQYMIIRQIGKHHKNVVMVGDDDQSIYRWRGARVANLRRFIKDFGARTTRLEENFRSYSGIVEGAKRLIAHNQARLPKNPYSKIATGDRPELRAFYTDREMANDIVEQVKRKHDAGVPLKDMAVLYRTNRMTQILEPALKRAGIPYSVVGGMSFYERAEIQAVQACARIAWKHDDWQALKNLEPYIDGVGKKGLSDAIEKLKDDGMNLLEFMLHESPQQYGKAGIRLREFVEGVILNSLAKYGLEGFTQADIAEHLIQWMKDGPMKILDREKDDVLRERREQNLEQLLHEIAQAKPENFFLYMMEAPLSDYVASKDDQDHLTLSTIHRSKGLEWPHVLIAGFSDGLMPFEPEKLRSGVPGSSTQAEDDSEDGGRPEEERSLCYVAMTRAMENVSFYHANYYSFPGSEPAALELSRYSDEIGLDISPQAAEVLSAYDEPADDASVSTSLFGRLGMA
ncbi:ATP-dependent helicase [Marinobacter sp. MBR-105]